MAAGRCKSAAASMGCWPLPLSPRKTSVNFVVRVSSISTASLSFALPILPAPDYARHALREEEAGLQWLAALEPGGFVWRRREAWVVDATRWLNSCAPWL